MKLQDQIPHSNHILAIAERVKKKFPTSHGMCEFMTVALVKELKNAGIRAQHVMGNFKLDEPAAYKYISPEDEDYADDYDVAHDWATVEGKILDISADQFNQYVHDDIPPIVFIGYGDPLYTHYEELGYV